ncbi:hypothetical protein HDU86_004421 [Geranomyces michiganensis]|nr:hypothetical protein HDU86_004421 [Geranomyces michiganensis]
MTVPPRPTITAPCTCIWASSAVKHSYEEGEHADEHRDETEDGGQQSRSHTLLQQVREAIPEQLRNLSEFNRDQRKYDEPPSNATITPVELSKTDQRNLDAHKLLKAKALQQRGGSLALKSRPDVLIRAFKRRISQSSENKLGDLISYREDLYNTLITLIPTPGGAHTPHKVHLPAVRPLPSTPLCSTCTLTLAHEIYVSPAVRSPYIRAHSTAAYLALVDDAVAALDADSSLERITHSQLNAILRNELSVVERRISLRLARYHKRTGIVLCFLCVRASFFNSGQVIAALSNLKGC